MNSENSQDAVEAGFEATRMWLLEFRKYASTDPASAAQKLCGRLRAENAFPDIWEQLANALLRDGQVATADELLRSSLSVYPQNDRLRCLLGNALRVQGRYCEAERQLRTVLASDPVHNRAMWSLAYLLREQGCFNAAAETVLKHGSRILGDIEQVRSIATFLAQCGHHLEALQICDAALSRCENGALLGLSGVLASTLGRFNRAETDLLRAVQLDPGMATPWLWLAMTHKFQNREDRELRALEAAAAKVGGDTDVGICIAFARGKAYDDIDDIPAAVRMLRAANAAMAARAPWDPEKWEVLIEKRISARIPEPVKPPPFIPVFVVGLPRTGTTLLANLLSRHPQIRNRGEMGWLGAFAAQVDSRGITASFLNRAAALYAVQLRQDDEPAQLYIDKNPNNFLHLDLVSAMLPNARVIHCRRNPRDTALSIWRQHFGSAEAGFAYRFKDIAQVAAGHDRLMRHWEDTLMLPIYELDYEALVARPDETVSDVLRFLGVDDSRAQPASEESEAEVVAIGTASLWQARQPVNSRSVGRWKAYAPCVPELLHIPEE